MFAKFFFQKQTTPGKWFASERRQKHQDILLLSQDLKLGLHFGNRTQIHHFNQPTTSATMIKKIASIVVLVSGLFTLAQAQRIAYVDVTAVLESMPEYQKAQEQLDKAATAWRQEIAQEQDKVKGLYSKFQAEQVLLSEEMKKTREEEIMAKEKEVRELQRLKFGPEGALFKKREELVKPIQDKVYATIERFAQDKGFEFIFDKGSPSGMLYADKKNDKTEDIKALVKKG